jgi:hypothetical protein
MTFGLPLCACCGSIDGVERHHLYLRSEGCPDDLTVWLCHVCHGRAYGMGRRMNIRQRTKDALAVRKAQGVKLGGLNAKGVANREEAKARAEALRPVFAELAGKAANAIAAEQNKRGVPTPTGSPWSAKTVIRVLRRLEAAS